MSQWRTHDHMVAHPSPLASVAYRTLYSSHHHLRFLCVIQRVSYAYHMLLLQRRYSDKRGQTMWSLSVSIRVVSSFIMSNAHHPSTCLVRQNCDLLCRLSILL